MTSQRLQYRLMVFLGLVSHLCLLLSRKPSSAWMNMSAKKQTSTNRFIPNKAAGTQFGEFVSWTCFEVLQSSDILCTVLFQRQLCQQRKAGNVGLRLVKHCPSICEEHDDNHSELQMAMQHS
jgi:hypothetical protein